jgi:hypothetical protein
VFTEHEGLINGPKSHFNPALCPSFIQEYYDIVITCVYVPASPLLLRLSEKKKL